MKRSKFSLSHYKLLTCDMGYLIPITWYEALPGDSIQQSTSMLVRVSPLLAPVMHPVRVRIHHWFVPIRLIWEDWENFITGGPDGLNSSTPPYVRDPSVTESSLMDYLGVPPATYAGNFDISALPMRAYNLIYNEHYRDQDICTEQTIDLTDGADSTTNTALLRVAWEKDYFTTARPWETKGATVTIPLSGDAPVTGFGKRDQTFGLTNQAAYETDGSGSTNYPSAAWHPANPVTNSTQMIVREDANNTGYPDIRADLTSATGMSINDLREALAIQRYQEARAQYGSRYVEYLRYLGVRSSDARLANPEYLGGGRQIIQFSEVLSTDGANTGDLKGHGIAAMRTNRFRRFFEEHGIVMSLMSVIPKSMYANGLHKFWSRGVKEDYFQKELQFMGEQTVANKELYTEDSGPDDTFGYQAQYDEYRSLPSDIAGEFHTSLNHWHLGRIFSSDVALNQTFIDANPTKRVLASSSTDGLYIMANHSIQARRMMSKIAKPRTF